MTRIKRPQAKQQRGTLVTAIVCISGILLLTIYLFQLDGFPKRRSNLTRRTPVLTPEKLLAQELERKANSVQDKDGNTKGEKGGARMKAEFAEEEENDVENGDDKKENDYGSEEEKSLEKEEESVDEEESNSQEVKEENVESNLLRSRKFAFELANLRDGKSATIVVETRPEWAPIGVNHLHELIDADFYNECRLFRVIKNFMAQFGMAADPNMKLPMVVKKAIKDDPVLHSNTRGTVTFAMSGKDTRSTQLFLNFKDNSYLDKEGFAPIAEIISGIEHLEEIYDEYGETPQQGLIWKRGNEYLNEEFPNLSYIVSVRDVSNDDMAAE